MTTLLLWFCLSPALKPAIGPVTPTPMTAAIGPVFQPRPRCKPRGIR
jgi:hypothetical protein